MVHPERTLTIVTSIVAWPAILSASPEVGHIILGIVGGALVTMLADRFRPEAPARPRSWEEQEHRSPRRAIPRRGRLPIGG